MADETDAPLAPPDEYERRYMQGDRASLRSRQRQPRWVPALALAVMLSATALVWPSLAFLWARRDLPGMGLFVTGLIAWFAANNLALLFALLTDHITRVALTPSHLIVHRGLWTDEIPLSEVTAVEVESARWWQPRHTLKGALLRRERSYLTPGVDRALRVEWRDAKSRDRKVWVQFGDAAAFASRIGSMRGGATGVRVEPDHGSEVDAIEDEGVRRAGLRAGRGGA